MERWSIMLALGLTAVLAACSGPRASGDVHTGPGGSDAVEVVMRDGEFAPDKLELEAGAEVTVEITNESGSVHNFTIDGLDLSTGTMREGDVNTATFTAPGEPTDFHCTFHPGMDGTIVPS